MTREQKLARATGVAQADLFGIDRHRRVVRARWAIMVVLRERGNSMKAIGRIVMRDHTTVVSGLQRAAALADDPSFARMVERCRDALGPKMRLVDASPGTTSNPAYERAA